MLSLALNPFDLPPVAAALSALQDVMLHLSALFAPWAGAEASAAAIVALTMAVRLVLLPVAVSQVRAEVARRRLAPEVARIRKQHSKDQAATTRALQKLYADEHVSPVAGLLPTLVQLPVLSAVYALFTHSTIAGHANLLLAHTLFGAVLGANAVSMVGAPAVLVPVVVLALLAAVIEFTRRSNARYSGSATSAATTELPGVGVLTRVLPFATVVFAALAPLAAALYLVASAAWTAVERPLLRRRILAIAAA